MLNCPWCASADKVKSGIKEDRQRYKCKACQCFFSLANKSDTATPAQRHLALNLYLEGLGFRFIGRILRFSHVVVYQWVETFGENLEQIKRPVAQIVELDELHSYGRHKKATVGSGLLLIDLGSVCSMLSLALEECNGGQLWDAIQSPLIAQVMTDCWEPCAHLVPPEKHIHSESGSLHRRRLQ